MTGKNGYLIGIDLGTTNCTLAYQDLEQEDAPICQLPIPQLINATTIEESLTLPSFIYFPLEEEKLSLPKNALNDSSYCIGIYARDRGAEVPNRLISSAKSWLCFGGRDRRERMLPLHADPEEKKMSALEACAALLDHLKNAWNAKIANAPFENQEVFITIPASFDPAARQLVQEAAQLAGYPAITLLEEPQAAFYAWLNVHQTDWRTKLRVGDNVLVVDIGGGTTDFSLITMLDEEGKLGLRRLAVGSHLLLGGDNIDLSLAYLAKGKLEAAGHEISDWQLQCLVYSCRQAKEKLLSDNPPQTIDITVMGRGSRLIGGLLKTELSLKEVEKMIIDGFFPMVEPTERSHTDKLAGIQQVGLPYAKDGRISCQLAKFLSMTGEDDSTTMDHFVFPSAVLFNGGSLKPQPLRQRIIDLLTQWNEPVKVLEGIDLDFAVSRGAVYYGLARQGKGVRIKSGASRSYFIGVEDALPAVPGYTPPLKAVCIVPFGMEEGSEQDLQTQEFALVVGEPVAFRFFSHATDKLKDGTEPIIGSIVRNSSRELTELDPIETILDRSDDDGKTIRVKLKSVITEVGVLELWCCATDGRRWKLEFDIREREAISQNQ